MLKLGELNNCENCHASYSTYNNDGSGDWVEAWSELPEYDKETLKIKEPKGLCQFCNSKTKYYNK